jgi:hydrogenase/urease accessory protein HupE
MLKQILIAACAALAMLTTGTAHGQSVAPGQSKADYLA